MRESLPLLERMPALARRSPLTPTLAVFETFTMEKEPRQYRDSSSGQMRTREYNVRSWAAAPTTVGAARVPRCPSEAEGVQYRRLCLQNATCFNKLPRSVERHCLSSAAPPRDSRADRREASSLTNITCWETDGSKA